MLPAIPLVVEAAGQTYTQTMQLLYLGLGGLIDANADIIPEIKRRIPLAWACYDRFTRELYDMENASFMPVEYRGDPLMYGCVAWAFGLDHLNSNWQTTTPSCARIIGFQRPQHTDHRMSYAKALKKAQCESVEATIGKRRLLLA